MRLIPLAGPSRVVVDVSGGPLLVPRETTAGPPVVLAGYLPFSIGSRSRFRVVPATSEADTDQSSDGQPNQDANPRCRDRRRGLPQRSGEGLRYREESVRSFRQRRFREGEARKHAHSRYREVRATGRYRPLVLGYALSAWCPSADWS